MRKRRPWSSRPRRSRAQTAQDASIRRVSTRRPGWRGRRPTIDGRLDDEAWRQGEWSGDYRQQIPVEGAAPSQPTELKILYDERNVYVAIRAYDDPAKMHRWPSRRDEMIGDIVGVCFDSDNDKRIGLRVRPHGRRRQDRPDPRQRRERVGRELGRGLAAARSAWSRTPGRPSSGSRSASCATGPRTSRCGGCTPGAGSTATRKRCSGSSSRAATRGACTSSASCGGSGGSRSSAGSSCCRTPSVAWRGAFGRRLDRRPADRWASTRRSASPRTSRSTPRSTPTSGRSRRIPR